MTRTIRRTALLVTVLTILASAWWVVSHRARVATPGAIATATPVRGGTLVVSVRSEPDTYNRHVRPSAAVDALSLLTQARLVRINRITGAARAVARGDAGPAQPMA